MPGLTSQVLGVKEAQAAFRLLPEISRDEFNRATEHTLSQIVRGAVSRIDSNPSIRTRSLRNNVGWSLNRKTGWGKAGISTGQTRMVITSAVGKAKTIRVKGIVVAGRNGSALRSEGAKLIRPTRYGHLVEFKHNEPFMKPSAEAQIDPYLARCRDAGKAIERGMRRAANTGGGLL